MLRRHYFLAAAVMVLALMLVAGGLRLAAGRGQGGAGPGGGASAAARADAAAAVSTATVQMRTFTETVEALGVAKGRRAVTLTAAGAQLVERVRFEDGEWVPQGAVLVELKDTEEDAVRAQAQARLVEAERAYQRYRTLGEKGFASKASIDQYEAAWRSAQADLRAAQARRGDRMIRAPFAGVVGLSDIAPGALVNPGAAIVTLDDLSSVRVDFPVPERHLAALREGQPITASADAYPGQAIPGRIAKLDTRVDERTRAVLARAEFPNPDRRLKPGMMMRVGIAGGQRQGLAVPEAAVSVQGDSAFVFVLAQRDGRTFAEQRTVTTGARQQGWVELREGVSGGERIVADGLHRLQPGQPVKVAGTSAKRPAS